MIAYKGKCLVIAEIASAHNGNIDEIKELIKASSNGGADFVNLQIFDKDELIVPRDARYKNFEKIEFARKEWKEILDFAKTFDGLKILITPFDSESLRLFCGYADAIKLPSSDIDNPFLIDEITRLGKPVFIACGGSTKEELRRAVESLKKNCEVILMHGFQAFPTKIEDTNLELIEKIYKEFGTPVGFLDHINGEDELAVVLPAVAVGAGAVAIEKHITLDRSKKGFDYYSSLEPDEFKRMVELIRRTEVTIGDGEFKMSEDELNYRKKMKKNIVVRSDISRGSVIRLQDLAFKRSEEGFSVSKSLDIIGKVAKKDIKKDEVLTSGSFGDDRVVICLAVRLKSNRLPRKAFAVIEDQTAIEHEIDRLKATGLPVILCTSTLDEDTPLVYVAQKKQIKYYRGHDLNVMQRFIEAAKQEGGTIVVRTTGDRPLISPEYILRLVEHHIKTGAEYTYCEGLPAGISSEVMSLSALEKANRLAENPNNSEYMTLYFRRPDVFRVEKIVADQKHKRDYRITLDTPKDLEVIKNIYAALYEKGKIIPFDDIITLLDSDDELAYLNKDVKEMNLSNINLKLKGDK